MTDEITLVVKPRSQMGTSAARRLRREGLIPGNLYGHKQDAVPFSTSQEAVNRLVHSGTKVVDIALAGRTEKAIIREVQWDPFGVRIQHVDLVRVDTDERVTIEVAIELRGVSPGAAAGGVLEQNLHSLIIDCPVFQIPSQISVRISSLQIGDAIHVRDLPLPGNTNVHHPPDTVVVHVVAPIEFKEPELTESGPAEPELIGRKAEPSPDEE